MAGREEWDSVGCSSMDMHLQVQKRVLPPHTPHTAPEPIRAGGSHITEMHDLIREGELSQSIFQLRQSSRSTIGREEGLKWIKI